MLQSEREEIENTTNQFNQQVNDYLNTYKQDVGENTGVTGYQNALNQAKSVAENTAASTANAATAQAQSAAQNAGMSKAAAAMNAANTAANTYAQQYGSTLANQQNTAQQYQQSKVNASGNIYNKQLENAKMIYQQKLAEYQDKIDRRNQLYNMIASFAMSGAGAVKSGMDWLTAQAANRRNNAARGALNDANATITSDEKAKKSNIDNFLDHLQAYAFEYKDKDKEDGDQHVGVTAQDVQETRPDMVEEDEDGRLQINRNKLIETVAAGLAELKKEMEQK